MKRLIFATALALGLMLPAMAGAIAQPIYFWGSVAAPLKSPGQPSATPEVIRPSLILLTEDGSSDLDDLHWTGWGSSVAHATGISSASNGIPNMAQGKRIKKPARVTLSNPGLFQGHEVYRCFTLTVPPAATSEGLCLTDQGGSWVLAEAPQKQKGSTPIATTPPTTPTTAAAAGSPPCTVAAVMAALVRNGLTGFVIEHSLPLKCAARYAVAIGTDNGLGPETEVLYWSGSAWAKVSSISVLCGSGDLPSALLPIVCQ
jgi:hypothetical protein